MSISGIEHGDRRLYFVSQQISSLRREALSADVGGKPRYAGRFTLLYYGIWLFVAIGASFGRAIGPIYYDGAREAGACHQCVFDYILVMA